jgi:hypothetical protein
MIDFNFDADLACLLAETDVLWRPIRDWTRPFPEALTERREVYHLTGLPVPRLGGADDSERQRRSREMRQVQRTGMVCFGGRRGQHAFWRLTPNGDWHFRAMCGLPGHREMMLAVETLRKLERVRGEPDDNRIPEYWLCGDYKSDAARRRMSLLQLVLAPALCRGFVHAWSDAHGHVAYASVRSGSLPDEPRELPEYDPVVSDAYDAALAIATDALATARPIATNLCVIPFSVGCWPPIPKSATRITRPLRHLLDTFQ